MCYAHISSYTVCERVLNYRKSGEMKDYHTITPRFNFVGRPSTAMSININYKVARSTISIIILIIKCLRAKWGAWATYLYEQ